MYQYVLSHFLVSLLFNQPLYSCDQVKLDGSVRSASDPAPYSYSHAMKMRAAMTYIFGHLFGAGVVPWHENEAGIMVGNPSISTVVSRYMVSLRKRKTRAGEQATSARALTPEKLERLYDFNNAVPCTPYTGPTPRASKTDQWMAGGRQRRMLQCIYTIAFSCLLRSDEVLKIKFEHIKVDDDGRKLVLTLPFRKTAQYGSVKPFILHRQKENYAYACAVRALARWMACLDEVGIHSGYLFRKFASGDRIMTKDEPMTSDNFLEMFRNNLVDIEVDPVPYGTHSFRRGGCQYWMVLRRWNLRRLCDWGGWSTEFNNLTIVKYVISWNDDPLERREDYTNPDIEPTVKCYSCGRSCHCS
ncbi:DNA breaking-rejoining enzyme [Schizophyllum commune]